MTYEQWLIYLYGIYPEGGAMLLVSFTIIFILMVMIFTSVVRAENIKKYKMTDEQTRIQEPIIWLFSSKVKYWKYLVGSLFFVWTMSVITPNKKIFLMIIATPTLMESITKEDGKLNKLNLLFDKILDKADKYIEEEQ